MRLIFNKIILIISTLIIPSLLIIHICYIPFCYFIYPLVVVVVVVFCGRLETRSINIFNSFQIKSNNVLKNYHIHYIYRPLFASTVYLARLSTYPLYYWYCYIIQKEIENFIFK